ncbi:MAG TPA: putative toxin-antitoxin system toxin component, PIN family [Pantanalinema sp.]
MLEVVLDTSVFTAALMSPNRESAPNRILDAWRGGRFTLVMAPQLLRELVATLRRRRIPDEVLEDLVEAIGLVALHIPGSYVATRLDAIDPADNMFLAAAIEGHADYLVSLDRHLLHLKHYHGSQIRTPALFLRQLNRP